MPAVIAYTCNFQDMLDTKTISDILSPDFEGKHLCYPGHKAVVKCTTSIDAHPDVAGRAFSALLEYPDPITGYDTPQRWNRGAKEILPP